jgi:hypothetical protein
MLRSARNQKERDTKTQGYQLLLEKADVGAISRQLELALLYDGSSILHRWHESPNALHLPRRYLDLSQPETNADDPIGASLNRS